MPTAPERSNLPAILAMAASFASAACDREDCSSASPGHRSIAGEVAFRFDEGLVTADLSDPNQHGSLRSQWGPISRQRLQYRWTIGASDTGAHLYLDVDGIAGTGTFSLAELAARACGCPAPSSGFDFDAEVRCVFPQPDGSEHTEAALCEPLEGELVVGSIDDVCSENNSAVCAPNQDFDVRVPERSDARFSGDIHVEWFDVIDEKTCTGSPVGPVA